MLTWFPAAGSGACAGSCNGNPTGASFRARRARHGADHSGPAQRRAEIRMARGRRRLRDHRRHLTASARHPRYARRACFGGPTNEVEFHRPGKETCGRLLALLVGLRALQPVKNLVAIVDAGRLSCSRSSAIAYRAAEDTTVTQMQLRLYAIFAVCAIRSDRSVSSRLAQTPQCLRSNEGSARQHANSRCKDCAERLRLSSPVARNCRASRYAYW